MDASGEVIQQDISGEVIRTSDLEVTPPPPPPQILLADILNAAEVVAQKETQDKSALESVGTIPFDAMKTTLIQWAKAGFPNAYPIYAVPISPPEACSDGVKRTLTEYVSFLTGKTMSELIAPLQARCPEVVSSFATTGPEILIVVSRA